MTVLVTGARGAVGRMVVDELAGHGHDVVATDVQPPPDRPPRSAAPVGWVAADLLDDASVDRLLAEHRPDVVVHLAAVLPAAANRDLATALAVNATATQRLLRTAVEAGTGHVVQVSSKGVYGELPRPYRHPHYRPVAEDRTPMPRDNYGLSKLAGEHVLRQEVRRSGVNAAVLRLGSTYGPGKGPQHGALDWLSQLVQAMRRGTTVTLRYEPGSRTDLVYNRDVARAVHGAVRYLLERQGGEPVIANVGSGATVGLDDVAAAANEVAGRRVVSDSGDATAAAISVPATGLRLDVGLAQRLFGFTPAYDLRAGLTEFLACTSAS